MLTIPLNSYIYPSTFVEAFSGPNSWLAVSTQESLILNFVVFILRGVKDFAKTFLLTHSPQNLRSGTVMDRNWVEWSGVEGNGWECELESILWLSRSHRNEWGGEHNREDGREWPRRVWSRLSTMRRGQMSTRRTEPIEKKIATEITVRNSQQLTDFNAGILKLRDG